MTIARTNTQMTITSENKGHFVTGVFCFAMTAAMIPLMLLAGELDATGVFLALIFLGVSSWLLFWQYHQSRVEIDTIGQVARVYKKRVRRDFELDRELPFAGLEKVTHLTQLQNSRGNRISTVQLHVVGEQITITLLRQPSKQSSWYKGSIGPLEDEARMIAKFIGIPFEIPTGWQPLNL